MVERSLHDSCQFAENHFITRVEEFQVLNLLGMLRSQAHFGKYKDSGERENNNQIMPRNNQAKRKTRETDMRCYGRITSCTQSRLSGQRPSKTSRVNRGTGTCPFRSGRYPEPSRLCPPTTEPVTQEPEPPHAYIRPPTSSLLLSSPVSAARDALAYPARALI